mgnify:CR=1 FL=1
MTLAVMAMMMGRCAVVRCQGARADGMQQWRRCLPGARASRRMYLPGGGKAIHLRHLAVHEHGGIGQTPHRVESLAAVGGDLDLVAHFVEQAHHHPLIDGVIFDHQNTRAAAGLGGSVGSGSNECRSVAVLAAAGSGGRRGCVRVSTANGRVNQKVDPGPHGC